MSESISVRDSTYAGLSNVASKEGRSMADVLTEAFKLYCDIYGLDGRQSYEERYRRKYGVAGPRERKQNEVATDDSRRAVQ